MKIKNKCLSKKHKFFSTLTINENIVRNPGIHKYKDIIQPYYNSHEKKIDDFTVCIMWKKNGLVVNKISVPSIFTREKPHLLKPSMTEILIVIRVSPLDFLDTFDKNRKYEVDEIVIIFLSELEDMPFSHFMAQPKPLLCRKLVRNFIEEVFGDFDYIWLPNCFRHIKI